MRVLPALAVLSLAATSALADPAPGSIMKASPPASETAKATPQLTSAEAVKYCLLNYQKRVAMLGTLATRLKLTAQQQPLFDTWRKAMLEITHASLCPAPPTGLSVPTPERLSNQIKLLEITLTGLRKEQPAADALYTALSPEQRATFDGPAQ